MKKAVLATTYNYEKLLLSLLFSNTTLNGKKVEVSFHKAFKIIFDRVGELMGEKIDQNKIFEHLNKPVDKPHTKDFGVG